MRFSGSAVADTMFTGFLQPWVGGIVFSLGVQKLLKWFSVKWSLSRLEDCGVCEADLVFCEQVVEVGSQCVRYPPFQKVLFSKGNLGTPHFFGIFCLQILTTVGNQMCLLSLLLLRALQRTHRGDSRSLCVYQITDVTQASSNQPCSLRGRNLQI